MKAQNTTDNTATVTRPIVDFTRDTIKIKVSFSFFDGKLHSEKVAEDAAKAENADVSRIIGKIVAIPRSALRPLFRAKDAILRNWRMATRPWEDGGWRLGMVTEYAELRSKIDEGIREFDSQVRQVIKKQYAQLKAEAEKQLNGLLGDSFPTLDYLLARYAVRVNIDKVASQGDFRFAGVSEEEVNRMVAEREKFYQEVIVSGNRELVGDVQEAVQKMADALKDSERSFQGTEENGYPILKSVHRMLDRAEKWNVTQDAALAQKIADTRKSLSAIDLSKAKEDSTVRKTAAKTAEQIAKDLSKF
jgi:hypothetical protein